MFTGICRLCLQKGPLCASHIISRFIFGSLTDNALTGRIRDTANPNLSLQDGPKKPLLCRTCDNKLVSSYETDFAKEVFYPLNQKAESVFRYGPWMAKFAASVTWRVLVTCVAVDEKVPANIQRAENAWRDFLLDRKPNPGAFSLHMFLVPPNEPVVPLPLQGIETPANLNRYLMTCINFGLWGDNEAFLVYASLGGVLLVGKIAVPDTKQVWRPSRLSVKHGVIRASALELLDKLPPVLWAIIYTSAEEVGNVRLSDTQQQKFLSRLEHRNSLTRLSDSSYGRASLYDRLTFGSRAIGGRSRSSLS